MTNVAEESYGNVRTVKAFSNEREEILKFEAFNNEIYDISKIKAIWSGFFIFTV
jgi:ABC-type multidrug transport system fused ATPase/permease subunit